VCSVLFAGNVAEAAPAEELARKVQGVEVFDLSSKAVPIVDLWKDRKAVVAFARHFGWSLPFLCELFVRVRRACHD
jgi:hypothetical protein